MTSTLLDSDGSGLGGMAKPVTRTLRGAMLLPYWVITGLTASRATARVLAFAGLTVGGVLLTLSLLGLLGSASSAGALLGVGAVLLGPALLRDALGNASAPASCLLLPVAPLVAVGLSGVLGSTKEATAGAAATVGIVLALVAALIVLASLPSPCSARSRLSRAGGAGSASTAQAARCGAVRLLVPVSYCCKPRTDPWVDALRETEAEKREAEQSELNDDRAPLHPLRIYKELDTVLDRDAIVIGDGGDFVSYAGRVMSTYKPGCWMDPGPYGCLRARPRPGNRRRDGAPGQAGRLPLGRRRLRLLRPRVRHHGPPRHFPVVGIIGNNGIWALEYHPMRFLYGYEVAASLRPATRYDEVVQGARGARGARAASERAAASIGASVRQREAGVGECAD